MCVGCFCNSCSTFGVDNIATIKYYWQRSRKAIRFISTTVFRVCSYVYQYEVDQGTYFPSLIYAYNVSVHKIIKDFSFGLELMQTSPGPATAMHRTPSLLLNNNSPSSIQAVFKLI